MFDLKITMERDEGRCKLADGTNVRIVCIDSKTINNRWGFFVPEPILALKEHSGKEIGRESPITRRLDGTSSDENLRLTTLPETTTHYANVYSSGEIGGSYESIDDCARCNSTIGIIKITITGDNYTVHKVRL
jgi:hypothetical protein